MSSRTTRSDYGSLTTPPSPRERGRTTPGSCGSRPPRSRCAFSLIELLIALTITATLLAATLGALDASFKSYKNTTESASTHVVSRIVMYRLMSMIRTGSEFGPYPLDPLDTTQNPVVSEAIEFVAMEDEATEFRRIARIEKRDATDASRGPFELWYIQTDFTAGTQTAQSEAPLLSNVTDVRFTMEYDVGPRLTRATVDITVAPNDVQDARVFSDLNAPTVRFVSSACPRRLEEAE